MIDGRFGSLADAPASLLIAGARVLDPVTGEDEVHDVGVVDGRLVEAAAVPAGVERLDARGWIVAPGFVDLHVHTRDPGGDGESVTSASRAAARGGFTTICAMPNTDPPIDSAELVTAVARRAADAASRVRAVASLSVGRHGTHVADLETLAAAGAVAASDDGAAVPDHLAREAFERLRDAGLPLFEHAEDIALGAMAGAVMRDGATAVRLGLAGWPAEAERRVIERDLTLAAETGARLHLTHLSTRAAVEALREAKARGLDVTADVTPHHVALTDRWVAGSRAWAWEEPMDGPAAATERAYDSACRVNPPLGTADDARALAEALEDGTVDAIATDHAPHPAHRKIVPFAEAAPGMIGLETALSVGLAAVTAGRLRLETLIAALTTRPARVIGERRSLALGEAADLVAFDPAATWRVDRDSLASASVNTPLLGMELPGVVRLTVADGRVTYRS